MASILASHSLPCPQELIRKGIPHHFRAIVWQLLCSATDMPVKNQYSELLKMSSPCEKLIRRDIARTYPEHEFFKGQDSLGQEVLFNVMKVRPPLPRPSSPTRRSTVFISALSLGLAGPRTDTHASLQAYSLVDREVGYCQGSAFIVGLLLMQVGGQGPGSWQGPAYPGSPSRKQTKAEFPSSSQSLPFHPPTTSDSPWARPPAGGHRGADCLSCPLYRPGAGETGGPTQSPPRLGRGAPAGA